jgi:flagellar export protein FliJ
MNRFQFGLDKVLKFKARREWLAQVAQKQKAAVVQAAQAVEDGLRDQLDLTCLRLQENLGKPQETGMWMAVYAQSVRLEQALQSAKQKVEVANKELDQAAALRKQAAIEVEMLLALRQKKWQEYRGECQRATQAQLDDIGLQRWIAGRAAKVDEAGQEGTQT